MLSFEKQAAADVKQGSRRHQENGYPRRYAPTPKGVKNEPAGGRGFLNTFRICFFGVLLQELKLSTGGLRYCK
jgi:hypothetical protein